MKFIYYVIKSTNHIYYYHFEKIMYLCVLLLREWINCNSYEKWKPPFQTCVLKGAKKISMCFCFFCFVFFFFIVCEQNHLSVKKWKIKLSPRMNKLYLFTSFPKNMLRTESAWVMQHCMYCIAWAIVLCWFVCSIVLLICLSRNVYPLFESWNNYVRDEALKSDQCSSRLACE